MKTDALKTNYSINKNRCIFFLTFFIGIIVVFLSCRQDKKQKNFETQKERNKPEINIIQEEFRQLISSKFNEYEKDSLIKNYSDKYYMNVLIKHIDKKNETEYSHDKLQEYFLYLKFFSKNKTPQITSVNIDSLYETSDSIIIQITESFISIR